MYLLYDFSYFSLVQGNEKRLYEFIVRHFLACCSKDAQGQEVTVEIDIAEEKFSASGLTIIARNYLEVYPYDKWYNKVMLPVITNLLKISQSLNIVFVILKRGFVFCCAVYSVIYT